MNLLIGVCGSIAAYKSFDIARALVNKGHKVRVVLTRGALKFVRPEVFLYLGVEMVYTHDQDFFDTEKASSGVANNGPVLHITLANWCDRMVLVPLSANTLARLAQGDSSDLLASIFLSLDKKPLILYPAMNTRMMNHPFTQENLKKMGKLANVFIYPADEGTLACGDMGEGKLPTVDCIVETAPVIFVPGASTSSSHARERTVLITAGATVAPLDPVRYLTNPSSGFTGLQLALRYLAGGFRVMVVAGHQAASLFKNLLPLPQFTLKTIITAQDMEKEVTDLLPGSDVYISTAAVSDMEFTPTGEKVKKEAMNGTLTYKIGPDILQKVLSLRTPEQTVVGFAAETDPSAEVLLKKWKRKPVDLLIGNRVDSGQISRPRNHGDTHSSPLGFGTKDGEYFFVEDGKITSHKKLTKAELADEIYKWTDR